MILIFFYKFIIFQKNLELHNKRNKLQTTRATAHIQKRPYHNRQFIPQKRKPNYNNQRRKRSWKNRIRKTSN